MTRPDASHTEREDHPCDLGWSSQLCADPKKVDHLNAKRVYAAFPGVAEELGITSLLETPITDAAGVEAWTDSICNASVALPPSLHTGVLPSADGVHHYPAPMVEIAFIKYDDFKLWVTDPEGQPLLLPPDLPIAKLAFLRQEGGTEAPAA